MRMFEPRFKLLRIAMLLLVAAAPAVCAYAALIDWAKHEEWKRKQMEAILADVKAKGSAQYVVMSFRDYDLNKDGFIDTNESKAIEQYLRDQAAAAKKP